MRRILALLLTVTAVFVGCKKEDLKDIRSRLDNLEAWQASVNSDIATLKTLVTALEAKDFVMGVVPLTDGTGYVISFVKSGAVTVKHGAKGADGKTPVVGTKQHTDGKYYWTADGEWMLNAGAKILVTGEAPQMRINSTTNFWEVSYDGGSSWTSLGVKATGSAGASGTTVISALDNTSASYVELTLAGGAKILLPRYKLFRIGTDGNNEAYHILSPADYNIPISLPAGFKEADYTAIMAQITNNNGTNTHILTRASTDPWEVSVTKPTFTSGTCNNDAKVTVTPPSGIVIDETALLEITLVGNDGSKAVTSRVLKFVFAPSEQGDAAPRLYVDGTGGNARLLITYNSATYGTLFQFGSVVAWNYNNAGTAAADADFNPTTSVGWSNSWSYGTTEVAHTNANLAAGKGDPCRLAGFTQDYVRSEIAAGRTPDNGRWRLPTNAENVAYHTAGVSEWKTGSVNGRYFGTGATPTGTGGEFLPAAGMRFTDGSYRNRSNYGYYWSSTPNSGSGYYLNLYNADVNPQNFNSQAYTISVRCVRAF